MVEDSIHEYLLDFRGELTINQVQRAGQVLSLHTVW